MVDLANLADVPASTTVDFGAAGILNITWQPDALTPHLCEQLTSADPLQRASAIADLVVEWDLVDDDRPVAIEAVRLSRVPAGVLQRIAEAIRTASAAQ